ncbi:hypothetical protein FGRMN_2653 [Fusarium graminum]|nr:hypothetical protein FGRMN_2653 [Fusarium graminum]
MSNLAPQPPSEDEARYYYSGLLGYPRLIARTGREWVPLYDDPVCLRAGHFVPKTVDPVGQHEIVSHWGPHSVMRQQIIEVLVDIDWTIIDILRIGYTRQARWFNHDDGPEPAKPVTLLISVRPNTTTWNAGIAVVLTCRDVLRLHGIQDVEVDMMEACFGEMNTDTDADTPRLYPEPIMDLENESIDMSEFVGACIAGIGSPRIEGTKGFYVRLLHSGRLFAVTCRHVLFDKSENRDYRHNDAAPQLIIQPGDAALERNIDDLEYSASCLEDDLAEAANYSHYPDDWIAQKMAAEALVPQYQKMKYDTHKRTIGHVLFSPRSEVVCSNTTSGANHLRDWALVELHQNRHETPFSEQKNKVSAGHYIARRTCQSLGIDFGAENFTTSRRGHNTTLAITLANTTMPEAEVKENQSGMLSGHPMVVAKFGATSKFTTGITNNVTSVVRTVQDTTSFYSDELCILGIKHGRQPRDAFSKRGDSGSCIFDTTGRIVGMLTSGKQVGGENSDTTYATPIEWLLQDIHSFGYEVVLV